MSQQKRTPGLGDAPVTRARGGTRDRLRDAGGKELALLAKKVGNSQVGSLLGAATEKRDALLAFVERRLAEIQMVQHAEQKEMGDRREWQLRVARGASGFTLPDPTRWHQTTLLYRRAAQALCAGDLSRGAHLLDQAVAKERAAFDTVPAQVELPSGVAAPSMAPEERPFVGEGESAPATKAPALFQRADAILRITSTSETVPINRNNPTHRWWDVAEEEADAQKKDEKKPAATGGAAEEAARERTPEKTAKSSPTPEAEVARVETPAVSPMQDEAREVAAPAVTQPAKAPRRGKKADGR
ncbi:MAG: hypothetical protein Q8P41_04655 [Pseudomonadota bacterium]|nr:hypothetical protein [Pseudomonadota bacterium]